jgi:hypothetical protein
LIWAMLRCWGHPVSAMTSNARGKNSRNLDRLLTFASLSLPDGTAGLLLDLNPVLL